MTFRLDLILKSLSLKFSKLGYFIYVIRWFLYIRHLKIKFSQNNEVVFVGDGKKDKEAANTATIPFIARLSEHSGLHNEIFKIKDLTELHKVIQNI